MSDDDTETIYRQPSFWQQGNRVNTAGESLSIKIGIESENATSGKKRKKTKKGANRVKSTKYTLITFLPQNLFEQFRRIANFYFLCMSIISIVIDSPVSPMTSIVPLVFVICVTAAKQGYENFLRYRADSMVNKSLVTVIRDGNEEDIKCEDILQGDLVKIFRDCDVPCDLVLLMSSEDSGKCFITTANLDGESNLKTLLVPKGLPSVEVERLQTLGHIECEKSKTDLYSFNGRIDLPPSLQRISQLPVEQGQESHLNSVPLMAENLMLRGSRVKNTEWAIACAVYIGADTKLALNSKLTRSKMSSSEQFINKYLIFFLVLLVSIVTISYILKRYFDAFHAVSHKYLFTPVFEDNIAYHFFQDYFSFLILFNYLIPISLYVTIEMHKFIGSLFMEWDIQLYDEETNQPCIVNTSDLNEELGQVNILFSDKTGTLTKNEMIFQQCSINGRKYHQKGRGLQEEGRSYSLKVGECSKFVYQFFEALAICHTVQVAGNYNEDDDKDEEEDDILKDDSSIPDIFNVDLESSVEDEREEESVTESDNSSQVSVDVHDNINFVQVRQHKRSISLVQSAVLRNFQVSLQNQNVRPTTMMPINGSNSNKIEYHRTTSEITSSPNVVPDLRTHRRSQSNILQPVSALKPIPSISRVPHFRRNMPTRSSTREFYAAPAYTAASLLERNESIMRRQEIETFIEKLDYQAASPDERALVEACARLGLIYLNDNNDILKIRLRINRRNQRENKPDDEIVHFKRLNILEFTSDRKRMSVIVMDKNGQIWIYTKGAESHVLPLCKNRTDNLLRKTQTHINEFAKEGLRTLAVARKKLTKIEFLNYSNELIEANNSFNDRADRVEAVKRKIETGLELMGATAVEDALQDNVRDTLESLRIAGIKVWVLTGDKVETALNIALSCGHIPDESSRYFITECQTEEQVKGHLMLFDGEMKRSASKTYALLIDGSSLAIALKHLPETFRDIAIKCHAVLCCRLSPLQKCEVVHLIKTVPGNLVTAAVGDGANDVSMIQEAHVGLGIVGKEGRQAARCSDYAFSKFCMLKRALLLHGHYFNQRLSLLILYFFYKNLVFMGIQFYFQINSLFSSQSIYDSLFLTLYNVVYTALPILFISITEKVHTEEKLMNNPQMYRQITHNKLFGWKYFIFWVLIGVYHSLIIYYFGFIIWSENSALFYDGKTVSLPCFGSLMVHNVVTVVNIKLLLETVYKSYIFVGTILLSIFGFIGTTFVYNLFNFNTGNMFNVYSNLMSSLSFWLISILVIVTALLPDLTFKTLQALNIRVRKIFPGNKEMGTLTRRKRNRNVEVTSL